MRYFRKLLKSPAYNELQEKVNNLNKKMINPFTAFKDCLEEEILEVEAMSLAIKGINDLIERRKMSTKIRFKRCRI